MEKVGRLSDLLWEFADDPLLSNVLSLYGGTALNLLHISPPPRLSEDLDFNYRHRGNEDWGNVRDEVDSAIKGILGDFGYGRGDIRIQPRYNLGRFHVHYRSSDDLKDSIKIEIGYTRRIPLCRRDARLPFEHPIDERRTKVLTPISEELYANKWCTMVSRTGKLGYPRDLYDVANISERKIDWSLFIDLVMLEALLCEIDPVDVSVGSIDASMGARLNAMLDGRQLDTEQVTSVARGFTVRVIDEVSQRGWTEFRKGFIEDGTIRLDLLENPGEINPGIEYHPLLRWIREKRDTDKLRRAKQ